MDYELREIYFKELEIEKKELLDCNTNMLSTKYSKIIDCPLCGSKKEIHEILFIKDGYTFVRCIDCEMIFTNPQVDSSLLGELYGHSKANDIWVEIQESQKEQGWKKEYYEENIDLINKIRNEKQVNLIDIGCSSGYFLEVLKEYSPQINGGGVELSRKAYDYAKNKNLDVYNCFLSEIDNSIKYDIFTLFGVLEHLPNPFMIFDDIKKKANDGGLVLAIVPNAYSLYHMFLQEKSVSFDGRNHLLYFSEKTLRAIFEQSGFEVLLIDTVLTGLDNIKKQMQWLDPYAQSSEDKYLNKALINDFIKEKYILDNNLGLRLRIVAKLK
uniref:methyltransferase domain-containing protein n=1 Tax=Aliarcobacter sp. TaxID=2321116 RepID=UPI0040480F9C